MIKLDLTSLPGYAESCRRLAEDNFSGMTVKEVADGASDFNAYPGLDHLGPPSHLKVLEDEIGPETHVRAAQAILEGRIFWEHAAAGEATRLKMGAKFLIRPDRIEGGSDLLPLSLGVRHLGQWAFELRAMALEHGLDPAKVLARQKVLLIISEGAWDRISAEIFRAGFFGLPRSNFHFMVQASFHGLRPEGGAWRFERATPARLHNHGQMAMQKTMDGQIFRLEESGRKALSGEEYFSLLAETDDLVSYNIEDLDYLGRALDFETIGLALELGAQGYGMTMEITTNSPNRPVKGGLCAFDQALGRDVVIESFRLRDLPPQRISHLNKNFNHYPDPARLMRALRSEGLFMPVKVEDEALYFQPVQGDLNFLTRTAFITRRSPAPLSAWKDPGDTPTALAAMAWQDRQPGFRDFTGNLGR